MNLVTELNVLLKKQKIVTNMALLVIVINGGCDENYHEDNYCLFYMHPFGKCNHIL